MNLVIFTHFYELDGVIGSVRWTNLAHRLSKKHNVYVVTHKENQQGIAHEIKNGIDVLYIDDECGYFKLRSKSSSDAPTASSIANVTKKRRKNFLKEFLRIFLYFSSMKKTAKTNVSLIYDFFQKNKICVDYVISTSRPFIECFNSYFLLKKLKKKTPWILDQRDLPYTDGASNVEIGFYKHAFHKFERFVAKFTLVSYGMAQDFLDFCKFGKRGIEKTCVLHNGFTSDDCVGEISFERKNKIIITCVGDLYGGKRNANLLFDALKSLKDNNNSFSDKNVEIRYAGRNCESLYINAKKFGFENSIVDYGFMSHQAAFDLERKSDFLLLLTWNTKMNHGILPAKIYEYMLAKRPIICITAGDTPNGEAEKMIKDMRLGVAVNYCKYEQGVNELAEYICEQILRKKNGEQLLFNPDTTKVKEFDYDNLVEKLESIMF